MSSTQYGAIGGGTPQLVAYTSLWSFSVLRDMGEAEHRARFARALREAMDAQTPKMSGRALAKKMDVDPRRITAFLKGKVLPTLYESPRLAAALNVDEDLFRNPPEVPPPPPKPYYPIERYLREAVASGVEEGLRRARGPRVPKDPERLPRSRVPRARAG